MKSDGLIRSWYVLHTKSRFENVVNEGLLRKSKEVFLPKVTVRSKRRDRKMTIRVPLFPGYLFVKTDLNPHEHLEIVKTVGAVRLIGNKNQPVPVPSDTIESLRVMVAGDNPVATGTRFKKGDKVIVIYGPFAGVTGMFVRYRGKDRVVVKIEALGQWAGVEVNEDDVEKLPEILS
ncbi:transcription termination/antitermination protein NusG [Thermodesulfobacteriota bacterium]